MTRAQHMAHRIRWLILAAGVAGIAFGLGWLFIPRFLGMENASVMGTPAMWAPLILGGGDPSTYVDAGLFVGLCLVTQWMFLRPGRRWWPRVTASGRPLRTAVIGAAFAAMLLTVGAAATLMELRDAWEPVVGSEAGLIVLWAAMAVLWAGWGGVFFVYWRQGDRYSQLGRMIRGLLAGSLAETLLAAPVHVLSAHHRDCYCARGSYTGLVFGLTVMLWVFGPGIVLLLFRERYRRDRLMPICEACGYNLTGTVGRRCPECGAPVPDPERRSQAPVSPSSAGQSGHVSSGSRASPSPSAQEKGGDGWGNPSPPEGA